MERNINTQFVELIESLEARNRLQVMFPEDAEMYREQRWQVKMKLFELWNSAKAK